MKRSIYLIKFLIQNVRYRKLTFGKKNLVIGNNLSLGKNCFVSKKNKITIGDNFYMGNFCHLSSDLIIGNDVMFASFVSCVGGDHKIDNINTTINRSGRDIFKTTTVKDNVWIGHGSILIHGITIGEGAVIAAGSVVTKDVPENVIVAGNPAKFIRHRKLSKSYETKYEIL